MSGSSLSDALPIGALADALRQAGMGSIEITAVDGTRLLVSVAAPPVRRTTAAPTAAASRIVTATSFGHLMLALPGRTEALAPPGTEMRAGDALALLRLGCLQMVVRAPSDGVVAEVMADEGALLGYGAPVMTLLSR